MERGTVWWAIVEVLTSRKMYERLFRLLCLVSTLVQGLTAVAIGVRFNLR